MSADISGRTGTSTGADRPIPDRLVVSRSSGEETAPLRQAVLRPHFTVAQMAIADDQSPETIYLAVHDPAGDARVLGCLRLEPVACPWPEALEVPDRASWQLRAMATDPAERGTGLGRMLVEAAVDHVTQRGGDLIWCNARIGAEGFYSRMGFHTVTDPFAVQDTAEAHVGMVLDLPGRES